MFLPSVFLFKVTIYHCNLASFEGYSPLPAACSAPFWQVWKHFDRFKNTLTGLRTFERKHILTNFSKHPLAFIEMQCTPGPSSTAIKILSWSMSGPTLWALPFSWTTTGGEALHKVICRMDTISSRCEPFHILCLSLNCSYQFQSHFDSGTM